MMDEKNGGVPMDSEQENGSNSTAFDATGQEGLNHELEDLGLDRELEDLNRELENLNSELERARANRSALREQREQLREQRRLIREQIHAARAAGHTLETEQLERQLWEIRQQLEQLDGELDEAEEAVDSANDEADQIQDQIEQLRDEIEDRLDEVDEGGEEHDFLSELGEKMDDLLRRVKEAVSDIDWHAMGDQVTRTVDSAFNGVYDAVKNVQVSIRTKSEKHADGAPQSSDSTRRDGIFSGSISLDGGEWSTLRFSGSANIKSDVTCRSLHVSGSAKVQGNVTCEEEASISGGFKAAGSFSAAELRTSGGIKIGGDVNIAGALRLSGALTAGGDVTCKTLNSSGTLTVGGDCTAENVSVSGKLEIPGLLNAEEVHFCTGHWTSNVGSIGCGKLTVELGQLGSFFGRVFHAPASKDSLVCDSIEGDQLDLVATTAKTVRGVNVKIGPGCQIDQLEYSGTCEISPEAQVGNTVKVEG